MQNKKRLIGTVLSLLVVLVLIVIVYGRERNQNMPRDVVYKFLTADSKEEGTAYLYGEQGKIDEKVEKNIEKLSSNLKKNEFNYVMEQDLNLEDLQNGDYTRVKVYKNNDSGIYEDKIDIFYLVKIDDGYKINLNIMSDNNTETIDEFILNDNTENNVMKVYAKLDNYNNFSIANINKKIEKGDKLSEEEKKNKQVSKESLDEIDKYLSITLKDPDTGIEVQGFLEKNSYENEKYINYLNGSGLKQIVVEISKLDTNNINKVVKINSIKALNWGYNQ